MMAPVGAAPRHLDDEPRPERPAAGDRAARGALRGEPAHAATRPRTIRTDAPHPRAGAAPRGAIAEMLAALVGAPLPRPDAAPVAGAAIAGAPIAGAAGLGDGLGHLADQILAARTGGGRPAAVVANGDPARPAPAAPADAPTTAEAPSRRVPPTGAPALTPLEQAVHDLVERAIEEAERAAPRRHAAAELAAPRAPAAPEGAVALAVPTPGVAAATHSGGGRAVPVAVELGAPLPEVDDPAAAAAVNRLRMVVGDRGNEVVVTVAVRGATVDVSLRAANDATAAQLARNIGSLEHALRARGLDLGDRGEPEPDEEHAHRRHSQRDRRPQEDA